MNFITLFFIFLAIFSLYKLWEIKKKERNYKIKKNNRTKSKNLSTKKFFKAKKKPKKAKTSLENFLDNSHEWPKSVPSKLENKDPILSDDNVDFKVPSTISSVRNSLDSKRISLESINFYRERIIRKFK